MKNFNRRAISVALIITLGAMFSVNASAVETNSIESSIGKIVFAQGQQVMSDLAGQLKQSISEEISSFSIDFSFEETITESLAWLTDEATVTKSEELKQPKQLEMNVATEIKLLK